MNEKLLSPQKAAELAGALSRLEEIGTPTIITKEVEAEKAGLERFILNESPKHLTELLGCWFTVHQQYQPLLQTLAVLARTIGGIIARSQQMEKQQNESQTTAK